jgi:Tfp pilus assembly protein PilN
MAGRFNLARRPFVDTRPANLTAGILAVLVLGVSFVAVRTVFRYLEDSRRTREAITQLKAEITRLEDERARADASLARVDVAALAADVDEANAIALRRAFSWTRFLTRLEKTLPADVRVAVISLQKAAATPGTAGGVRSVSGESMTVGLTLISRDPNGLPKTIRAFDASPWFERPAPSSEDRGEKSVPEGRRLTLSVLYRDVEGRGAPVAGSAAGSAEGAAR